MINIACITCDEEDYYVDVVGPFANMKSARAYVKKTQLDVRCDGLTYEVKTHTPDAFAKQLEQEDSDEGPSR